MIIDDPDETVKGEHIVTVSVAPISNKELLVMYPSVIIGL